MSCWRTYSCEALKDVEDKKLAKALERMGAYLDTNQKIVASGVERRSEQVDAVIARGREKLTIGLRYKNQPNLEVVGDFWRTGFNVNTFLDELGKFYQVENVIEKLESQGYTIESMNTNQNEEVELIATAW